MQATRALLLAAIVVTSMVALPLWAGGGLGVVDPTAGTDDAGSTTALAQEDRDPDPSTEDTIGYVEGYWYDDEFAADERDDAALSADELEKVVYRSMARVEVLREETFRDEVPVEVISREEFREEEGILDDVTEEERFYENVRLEALFVADRDADALEEWESVYGGSVAGFYEPDAERIVLVSENADEPEVDEPILGHELYHALQDQRYDLEGYERDTQDRDAATDGLIEGDAVRLEEGYAERCDVEWSCAIATGAQSPPSPEFNWGLYFTIFHPYDDGPAYVEHLYEEGGWDAVDAAYDDPPESTSEVIRPGEEREPEPIEVDDRSSDAWEPYEIDGEVASDTVGEAGMVAMFADGVQGDEPSVIDAEAFVESIGSYDYDQEYTDGWAGDELVVYVGEEKTLEESGYVWRTEWTAAEEAEEFLEGYVDLLEIHGAEAVENRQDTFEIDSEYPGAYAVDRDGETVTIVRAPSVDDLSEIDAEAAPEGKDTVSISESSGSDEGDDSRTDGADDTIAGFGVGIALAAVLLSLLVVRART